MEALLFDMDGLLVDSEPLWRKAEIAVFGKYGLSLTEDDCRRMMGHRLNEVVAYWYAQQPWKEGSPADVEAEILEAVTSLILCEAKALPGVYEALALAKSSGLKTAIASSSPLVLIEAVAKKLGIQKEMDVLHSAQFEKLGKPDPAVFLSTATKLGVSTQNCLVLEDSYHGMVAGLRAEMRVIVVPAEDQFADPKFDAAFAKLHTLNELSVRHFD